MSSLRHQNDPSFDEDEGEISDSQVELAVAKRGGKGAKRPGRPRGKGRPRRSSKHPSKRISDDQEDWEEKPYIRERVVASKQQSSIEGYIKIIDYLKKIDYDPASLQNKMNPYNALTATCFWYAVSAEYFGYDFNSKKNVHDSSLEILEKVQKLPLLIGNKTMKPQYSPSLGETDGDDLKRLQAEVGQKMGNMIPAPLAYRPEFIERKIPVSSVAEDDQFISSTRSILYNYISKKIKNSEKWSSLLSSYSSDIEKIPVKEFEFPDVVQLQKQEEMSQEINLEMLLRQQAKKKVHKKDKKVDKAPKESKQDDIFEEDEPRESPSANEKKESGVSPIKKQYQVQGNQHLIEQNKGSSEKMEIQGQCQVIQQQQMKDEKIEQEIDFRQEHLENKEANKQIEKKQQSGEKMMEEEEKEELPPSQKEVEEGESVYRKKYSQQDLILNSIRHMPLDKVISILQSNLPTIQLPKIQDSLLPIPTKDPLQFVFQLHPQELKYLEYMKQLRKRKYRQKIASNDVIDNEEEREGQYEDAKCQICTDGDYTDDNLIVFCSMCNISLHQRCVGLAKVPAESWVCDVCLAFGPAGINLPCPLCNVKGGAMKRTTIHIDSNLFKDTNPVFYEYAKKCPYSKQKEEYQPKEKMEKEEQPQVKKEEQHLEQKKEQVEASKVDEVQKQKQIKSEPQGEERPVMQKQEEKQAEKEGSQQQEVVQQSQREEEQQNQREGEGQKGQRGENEEASKVKVVRQRGEKQQDCYYDYFVKSTYPTDVPVCHYVWVHYVCAIWVPQCYFQQKNGMISVKGIENIDNKRFKSECFACKKNRCGAAVKCQDSECNKYYHPECARRKKVYMEQLNLEKLKYLIFCQQHQPLKLTRQLQYKKKKNREEIIKFARMIEKYIQTYRIAQFPYKLMKSAVPRNFIDTTLKSDREDIGSKKIMSVNSDEIFLKELIANLSKAKMMTVHLETVDTGYKITHVETPSKRQIRKCLNRYDQFWNSIKNGDSNEDNFRRYERIMMENQRLRQKLEVFLNGSLAVKSKTDTKNKKVTKKRGRQAAHVQTLIEEQGGIFCVCKKPYEGETDMFQCEVCGEWYHFACLGFIGSEEDAQKMEFTCMKCMKFQEKEKKEDRLNRYAGLFSSDSIIYEYRPPTPDLLSEEEVEPKNYQALVEEYKRSNSPKKEKVENEDKQLVIAPVQNENAPRHQEQVEVQKENLQEKQFERVADDLENKEMAVEQNRSLKEEEILLSMREARRPQWSLQVQCSNSVQEQQEPEDMSFAMRKETEKAEKQVAHSVQENPHLEQGQDKIESQFSEKLEKEGAADDMNL